MAAPQPKSELDTALRVAIDLGYDDVQVGLEAIGRIYGRLCGLSPKELKAQGGHMRLQSERAVIEMARLLSIQGKYQKALDLIETEELRISNLRSDDEFSLFSDRMVGFLKFSLGRAREAAELLMESLNEAEAPTFMSLPSDFFAVLQYRQYDLAHAWLVSKRDPALATKEWLAPEGVSLLHRMEAQLFVETGEHERAIIAYDKAARTSASKGMHTNGLAEDLIMAGRPNLGLRLLRQSHDDEDEPLWTAVALRALGQDDEANRIFNTIVDAPESDDEFQMMAEVLATCYMGRVEVGLAVKLAEYLEEGAEFGEVVQYSSGLALGMLGQAERTQRAFESAMLASRRDFDGHLLNRERWFHVHQLLSPEMQETVSMYFDPTLMPERYL